MNRIEAATAMLHKYNDLYSNTEYYKNHLADWLAPYSGFGVADMVETVTNAKRAAGKGKMFAEVIEMADINIQGVVFVNGVNCGRIA